MKKTKTLGSRHVNIVKNSFIALTSVRYFIFTSLNVDSLAEFDADRMWRRLIKGIEVSVLVDW